MSPLLAVVGGVAGLSLWLAMLEGPKMGGIIFRMDSSGNKVFTPNNIVEYIKAPFVHEYFWKEEFLRHNWVVMCLCGMMMGGCADKLFCY